MKLNLHVRNLVKLTHELGFKRGQLSSVLVAYYCFTVLSALLEASSMMMLVVLFTGGVGSLADSDLPAFLLDPLQELLNVGQISTLVPTLLCLFGAALCIRFGLYLSDGFMSAILRRKIQESVFRHHIHGDWAHMRNFSVGGAVGTNTQESVVVSKYMLSAVSAIYFFLGAIVMGGLALFVSTQMVFILGIIVLPLMLLIQKVFSLQSRLSRKSAELRNVFSSDITDRYNGLLQVQVDDNFEYHLDKGLNSQSELTSIECKIGACQAVIGSFNLLLIFTSLLGFSLWLFFNEDTHIPELGLIATVGMLGLRLSVQLNGVIAAIGNLARLSGSIFPVLEAMAVPMVRHRKNIFEPIVGIEMSSVFYAYGNVRVINDVSLSVKRKEPLVICGRSGKGKTTLGNLLAGLYFPETGEVHYIGASGKSYSGGRRSAKVGFVTQDIYLFKGTLRENLAAGRERSEEAIWSALDQVDASDFVRQLGGLDLEGAEAGRSLSGGQRRRLGIARVLLSGADILIFDEVTAGLDHSNKLAVLGTIERLSECYVIVLISHDPLQLTGQKTYTV